MKKEKKTILVLWEFDAMSEHAMEHAVQLAQKTENNIAILTICKNRKLEETQDKLDEIVGECEQKYKLRPFAMVKTGKFNKEVKMAISELRCSLVVCKTDGLRSKRNLGTKNLISLISWSNIPFIVIQDPPISNKIDNIVSPVDFRTENKEKLSWIFYLHKYYNSKVHIFKHKVNDPHLLKYVSNNLNFAKTQFKNKGIEYDITASEDKLAFSDQIIHFAKERHADVIVIMIKKANALVNYLFGSDEERILANEQRIPVMCLSPRTDIRKYGGFY
ncbi:MAG: universal stress protein [Bacteroidales bacterium]|nr:universal stress protein [Bacteroidales bacterium]